MENKRFTTLLNQNGQSTVEYILLVVVIVSLITAVLKSNAFEDFYGSEGRFATVYKSEIEFSYTNAYGGRKFFETPNYSGPSHESYTSPQGTRFFGAAQAYPAQ